ERPVQIVRKRHIAAGFPITDGLSFAKFAAEGGLRSDVEPKSEMRTQSHGVEAAEIIAVDAADNAARNESENVAIGKNNRAGLQGRNNAMLDLVEEVCGIHQRECEACDRFFGEEFVDVAADEIGTAQTAGLHGDPFGFEPF